jgi:NAD(P)-dependent dehydrogenase (short-subunit alcohol dehydrogenase family)
MVNPTVADLFSLKGKVALITGGAGWLGMSMTEALAQAGATVAMVDYSSESLARAMEVMESQELDVFPVDADLGNEVAIRDCVDSIAERAGRLDVLVNCAFWGRGVQLDDATLEDYQNSFIAVSSYALVAQRAVVHMRKVGGGSIINIGSMYGSVTGYPEVYEGICPANPPTYQMSKSAVTQLTRHMAVYWAKDNIRTNTLSPGPFPDQAKYIENAALFFGRLEKKVPMGRVGKPFEMKGGVVFLASDASSFVNGQNIMVDGGWTAW